MIPARPRTTTPRQRAAVFGHYCAGRSSLPNFHVFGSDETNRVFQSEGTPLSVVRRRRPRGRVDARMAPLDAVASAQEKRLPSGTFHSDTRIDFDDDALITTVTAAATVTRPFYEVANLMDPRGWAARAELWRHSYAVELDSLKRPRFDGDGMPLSDGLLNRRERLGETWKGVLFEQTDWEITERRISRFDVLLNIDFDAACQVRPEFHLQFEERPIDGGRALRHEYSLYQSLKGQLGYQVIDGGVDVDSGYAVAIECEWQGQRVTRVEVQKSVRYSDFTPAAGDEGPLDPGQLFNYLAPGIAGVWIGSLVGEGLNAPL